MELTIMGKKHRNEMEEAMQEALESVERIERAGQEGAENGVGDANAADGGVDVDVQVDVETSLPTASNDAQAAPSGDARVDALKDQLLRLAADFENFRKRVRREQDDLRKYGVENVVRTLLPVLDNLDRALKHANNSDPIVQGVIMVSKQFEDALSTFGVVAFSTLGEAFDPERHEAVGQQPAGDAAPGTVLEELERGYLLHDRLLRPAKVIVAAASP